MTRQRVLCFGVNGSDRTTGSRHAVHHRATSSTSRCSKRSGHTPDCYVRPGQYLHHLYIDGVKYVVAPALAECLAEAEDERRPGRHPPPPAAPAPVRHARHADAAATAATSTSVTLLGDPPPPTRRRSPPTANRLRPAVADDAGEDRASNSPFLFEMILRTIYNRGRLTGSELANDLKLTVRRPRPALAGDAEAGADRHRRPEGRSGDASFEYEIKPPKGNLALQDALAKTSYVRPVPGAVRRLRRERRRPDDQATWSSPAGRSSKAFQDLIITPEVFNEIGPAINSAASIFLFGYPGNGKTSHRRAHHPAHGRRHLHPLRRRGQRGRSSSCTTRSCTPGGRGRRRTTGRAASSSSEATVRRAVPARSSGRRSSPAAS